MKKKTHKIHLSTLNVYSACRKAILYFTAFIRGLSSNNGVLSNGCAIRYINAFPHYCSTSKGAHYFHRVVHLVVINIDQWIQQRRVCRCVLLRALIYNNIILLVLKPVSYSFFSPLKEKEGTRRMVTCVDSH